MGDVMTTVASVNDAINSFVWVKIGLALLLGTGVLMTILTKGFQFTHIGHWMKKTVGALFDKDSHDKSDKANVSQFQYCLRALRPAAIIQFPNIVPLEMWICCYVMKVTMRGRISCLQSMALLGLLIRIPITIPHTCTTAYALSCTAK